MVYISLLYDVHFQRVGCDKRLGSRKENDQCGVCGGDNSTCRVITGYFNKTYFGEIRCSVMANIIMEQLTMANAYGVGYMKKF